MSRAYNPAPRRGAPWTKAEDNRLLTAIERNTPFAVIAHRLGRHVGSIYRRWAVLKGAGGCGSLSMKQTGVLLGVTEKALRRWVALGWFGAERTSFRRRGRAPGRWGITHEAIQSFLRDERYRPAWRIERIADPIWRDEARQIRGHAVYLTDLEAAAVLCYSEATVMRLCREGRLRSVQLQTPRPGERGAQFRRYIRSEWVEEFQRATRMVA